MIKERNIGKDVDISVDDNRSFYWKEDIIDELKDKIQELTYALTKEDGKYKEIAKYPEGRLDLNGRRNGFRELLSEIEKI